MVMNHMHAKIKVSGYLVQKIEWLEQTDERTDGHDRSHYFPSEHGWWRETERLC